MSSKNSYLSLAIWCAIPVVAFVTGASAETSTAVPDSISEEGGNAVVALQEVVVSAPRIAVPDMLNVSTLDRSALVPLQTATSDAANLMGSLPGVSLYTGGGISSLPVIHGMADERIRTNVDGREVPSACGNHMNPPLSYIDPSHVSKIEVMGGITPVSSGGDSIGGTISIQSIDPEFAKTGDGILIKGKASVFTRSNGQNNGGNLAATLATDKVSLMLQGSHTQSGDYKDGHGKIVKSTSYESNNYSAKLAAQGDGNLVTVEVGGQDIPYQDFVNAHMDMVGNQAMFVNGRYEGLFSWGKLDTQVHWENTKHQMDVRGDKVPGMIMPMNTDGTNLGYLVKAEINLSQRDTLRVGNEYTHFGLDDWWPPSSAQAMGTPMGMCNTGSVNTSTCSMAPGTLWNINNGRRDRLGTFVEWNAQWDVQWSSLLGIRNDIVWMNADNVVGYNMNAASTGSAAYVADALAFNARDHASTDVNFDITALLRYEPDQTSAYEGGYARKTRSPNLYERYLWINRSRMSSRMNSAVGDANGYSGNIDLKPEVAHTLSFTAGFHDKTRKQWEFKATPYYTHVQDYIDADRCSVLAGGNGCTAANLTATSGLVQLQYANHDARLYGLDLSGRTVLGNTTAMGDFALSGVVGYIQGKNLDTEGDLYHIMPLNARLTLEHEWDKWSNKLEFQVVDNKDDVSSVRNELKTGGYGLVNLKSGYRWEHLRIEAGIDNLFNQYYNTPLGGVYWVGDTTGNTPVPGMGRSAFLGVTGEF